MTLGGALRLRLAAAAVVALLAAPARADRDPVAQRAHEAYDRGTAAYARGDFGAAAREYAAADEIEQSAIALQAGLDAALRADDAAIGADLLDRARARPDGPALGELVKTATTRFAGRTGRIRVTCDAPACLFSVDGVAMDGARSPFVVVGPHTVIVEGAAGQTRRLVEVKADEVVLVSTVTAPAPPPSIAEPARSAAPASPPRDDCPSSGVSPAWFFGGLGVTAMVGVVTGVSGVDTASKHDAFVTACGPGTRPASTCSGLSSDGASAQTRTNVLLGVTAALGAATLIFGAVVVRWRGEPRATLGLGAVGGAPGAVLRLGIQ